MVTDLDLIKECKVALAQQARRIRKLEDDLAQLEVLCRGE